MPHSADTWSTRQLTEFMTAVSVAPTEDIALREAIELIAEALDADVAAIVRGDGIAASVGWPHGGAPVAEVMAVAVSGAGTLDVPGRGAVPCVVTVLGDEADAYVVLARAAEPGFDVIENGLLR